MVQRARLSHLVNDSILQLLQKEVAFQQKLIISGMICVQVDEKEEELVIRINKSITSPDYVDENMTNFDALVTYFEELAQDSGGTSKGFSVSNKSAFKRIAVAKQDQKSNSKDPLLKYSSDHILHLSTAMSADSTIQHSNCKKDPSILTDEKKIKEQTASGKTFPPVMSSLTKSADVLKLDKTPAQSLVKNETPKQSPIGLDTPTTSSPPVLTTMVVHSGNTIVTPTLVSHMHSTTTSNSNGCLGSSPSLIMSVRSDCVTPKSEDSGIGTPDTPSSFEADARNILPVSPVETLIGLVRKNPQLAEVMKDKLRNGEISPHVIKILTQAKKELAGRKENKGTEVMVEKNSVHNQHSVKSHEKLSTVSDGKSTSQQENCNKIEGTKDDDSNEDRIRPFKILRPLHNLIPTPDKSRTVIKAIREKQRRMHEGKPRAQVLGITKQKSLSFDQNGTLKVPVLSMNDEIEKEKEMLSKKKRLSFGSKASQKKQYPLEQGLFAQMMSTMDRKEIEGDNLERLVHKERKKQSLGKKVMLKRAKEIHKEQQRSDKREKHKINETITGPVDGKVKNDVEQCVEKECTNELEPEPSAKKIYVECNKNDEDVNQNKIKSPVKDSPKRHDKKPSRSLVQSDMLEADSDKETACLLGMAETQATANNTVRAEPCDSSREWSQISDDGLTSKFHDDPPDLLNCSWSSDPAPESFVPYDILRNLEDESRDSLPDDCVPKPFIIYSSEQRSVSPSFSEDFGESSDFGLCLTNENSVGFSPLKLKQPNVKSEELSNLKTIIEKAEHNDGVDGNDDALVGKFEENTVSDLSKESSENQEVSDMKCDNRNVKLTPACIAQMSFVDDISPCKTSSPKKTLDGNAKSGMQIDIPPLILSGSSEGAVTGYIEKCSSKGDIDQVESLSPKKMDDIVLQDTDRNTSSVACSSLTLDKTAQDACLMQEPLERTNNTLKKADVERMHLDMKENCIEVQNPAFCAKVKKKVKRRKDLSKLSRRKTLPSPTGLSKSTQNLIALVPINVPVPLLGLRPFPGFSPHHKKKSPQKRVSGNLFNRCNWGGYNSQSMHLCPLDQIEKPTRIVLEEFNQGTTKDEPPKQIILQQITKFVPNTIPDPLHKEGPTVADNNMSLSSTTSTGKSLPPPLSKVMKSAKSPTTSNEAKVIVIRPEDMFRCKAVKLPEHSPKGHTSDKNHSSTLQNEKMPQKISMIPIRHAESTNKRQTTTDELNSPESKSFSRRKNPKPMKYSDTIHMKERKCSKCGTVKLCDKCHSPKSPKNKLHERKCKLVCKACKKLKRKKWQENQENLNGMKPKDSSNGKTPSKVRKSGWTETVTPHHTLPTFSSIQKTVPKAKQNIDISLDVPKFELDSSPITKITEAPQKSNATIRAVSRISTKDDSGKKALVPFPPISIPKTITISTDNSTTLNEIHINEQPSHLTQPLLSKAKREKLEARCQTPSNTLTTSVACSKPNTRARTSKSPFRVSPSSGNHLLVLPTPTYCNQGKAIALPKHALPDRSSNLGAQSLASQTPSLLLELDNEQQNVHFVQASIKSNNINKRKRPSTTVVIAPASKQGRFDVSPDLLQTNSSPNSKTKGRAGIKRKEVVGGDKLKKRWLDRWKPVGSPI